MFKSENELIDSESITGDSFETIALSNTKGFRECAATAIGVPADKVVGDGFEIHRGDAMELIKDIQSASVHLIAIDPPYFIDGMGSGWNREKLETKVSRANVVGRLPVGMQFNPKQGRDFERFMAPLAKEAMRILKPGGFFVSFSQARLYHRMAVAIEDAGFEVRDMLAWKYSGQAKAFSMDHFIKKMSGLSGANRDALIKQLAGWKTPQLRPQLEPIVLAQKPKEGTFVKNWMLHQTGLVNTKVSLDDKFPGNVFEVPKPTKEEKGEENEHLTVKPVRLMEHLISLLSSENQVVLDAFLGSGTTGVAARNLNRKFIGFELDPEYFKTATKRICNAGGKGGVNVRN